MTTLHLTKLHATGNDFLVWCPGDDAPALTAETAVALCDRRRGVGADGLITIGPGAAGADCTMRLQNADGGEAEMSGNGIRALAWVAAARGLARGDELIVDTGGGRRVVTLARDAAGAVRAAEVDMGPVRVGDELQLAVDGVAYRGTVADVGNPHFVCFVGDPAAVPLASHGPVLEHDAHFPHRANVEVARADDRTTLTMRVWERGVGETLSCGTGASAVAAVAHHHGLVGDHVDVHVPGGTLSVVLGETVRLGGPVTHVFDVDVEVA